MPDAPTGQRFSFVYLERSQPLRDSPRMRRRLGKALDFLGPYSERASNFATFLENELGVYVNSDFVEFYKDAEIRDVLDSITLVYRGLMNHGYMEDRAILYRAEATRILSEENVGYRLDTKCGVHLAVDREFDRNLAATMSTLQSPRFRAAAEAFGKVQAALDAQPPDGKAAIRDVFDAAEIVFKLAFETPRLGAAEAKQYLTPRVRELYAGNQPAIDAAGRMVAAFAEWCNGAHQYRHGQATEEPAPPPVDLALVMVSSGASYLRWLAEITR